MVNRVNAAVYRGPRPRTANDIWNLKLAGITDCLDLETGWYELIHGRLHEEDGLFAGSGIRLYHVPIGNLLPPARVQLDLCVMGLELPRRVSYVHCRYGMDRTGMVIAYYRVKAMGWDPEQAIEEMMNLGFHRFPYEYPLGWVRALKKALKV